MRTVYITGSEYKLIAAFGFLLYCVPDFSSSDENNRYFVDSAKLLVLSRYMSMLFSSCESSKEPDMQNRYWKYLYWDKLVNELDEHKRPFWTSENEP